MTQKINHWCAVCGKGYHACDSCDSAKSFTPWRKFTCTIEHFQLFMILREFNNGSIPKEEARSLIGNFDLSEKDTFKEGARVVIEAILKDDEVVRKTTKKKATKVEVVKPEVEVENEPQAEVGE